MGVVGDLDQVPVGVAEIYRVYRAQRTRATDGTFDHPDAARPEFDYVDGLMGAGFAVNNPNVQGGCGCGSSFTC